MTIELPPEIRKGYSLHRARGAWHIGFAWVTSNNTNWDAWLVCHLGKQQVQHNARTIGARSKVCSNCKAWLADRIMRQDFS